MTRPSRVPVRLASLLILLNTGVCLVGWQVLPDRTWKWTVALVIAPITWAFIELILGPHDGRRETAGHRDVHRSMVVWVAVLILVGTSARVALATGLIESESLDAVRRLKGVVRGAGILAFGNYLPKLLSPWAPDEEPFDWQRVHRFVGWVFVLGGAVTIFVWVALPMDVATASSRATLLAVFILALVRKFGSVIARSRPEPSTGGAP